MPLDNTAVGSYENQSPTLLSQQPVNSEPDNRDEAKNWGLTYNHLEGRLAGLRTWRWTWWVHWAQLAEFILPRRYHWLVTANRMTRGMPINNNIVDSTATLAMQICASGLWTGLTSPSRPWFKLDVGLPWIQLDEDGKEWLEDTEQRLYTVLSQSNFYNTMAQAFQDVSTFGTAPVIIYEDHEDAIRCYLPCAGEYYLDVGSRLSVDTLYREFTLNVSQIIEMFNVDNCPVEVVSLWNEGGGSLTNEFVVAMSIEPNFPIQARKNRDQYYPVPSFFEFREVYWLRGIKASKPLSMKGFHERPFMAARWSVVSNDAYGRGPGMDALPDTKQLQLETRRKAEFIDKLVRPPMIADAEMKNEPSSILPGNITYVNMAGGKKGFVPAFEVQPAAMAPMMQDITAVQQRIDKCFFVDIFMAISRMEGVQPRNELELTKRDLERLQVLGPFITLFETEFARPAIQRILAIMERRRMLKPMPQSLRSVPLKINYTSIMKQAQSSAEAVGMKDFMATAGGISSAAQAAGLPNPLRTVNWDKTLRKYGDVSNFPSELFFTDEEVQQHDQEAATRAQQQQAMQQAMAGVTAAKTLSETSTGGGTALGSLLGNGGGAPGGA